MISRRDLWPLSKAEAFASGFHIRQWYLIARLVGLPVENIRVKLSEIIRAERQAKRKNNS